MLRRQTKYAATKANLSLADFVAPKEFGIQDYMGGLAVTNGLGIEEHVQRFEFEYDDYSAIILKALAEYLAEALAEMMHQKVRKEICGYAHSEIMVNMDLIDEKYQGIRPAPGYSACLYHTEKPTLFNCQAMKELE